MNLSKKLDAIVLAPNGIGAISRIGGVAIVYLIVRFLPEIFEFLSRYTGLTPLSAENIARNSNVASIFSEFYA
ncbi:hypothetical protein [Cupriavidus pauculus]|uniref:Uncharacterized protein n=1 Tax=Cupriavidus pauculus TaxID=82633 RepID=A0A2N5C8E5_9BURK|nr:hypothetical protein [Cupriavidus pauculus]PLP98496.1 hypothetical protein CYJ10_21670 [Cupriavidus pauculus]